MARYIKLWITILTTLKENVVSEAARKARRSIAGLTGIMKRQSSITELIPTEMTAPIFDKERNNSGETEIEANKLGNW